MKRLSMKRILGTTLIALGLLALPVAAAGQGNNTGTGNPGAAGGTTNTTNRTTENDGFDWGWLGLVGLIGLMGLANRGRSGTTTGYSSGGSTGIGNRT